MPAKKKKSPQSHPGDRGKGGGAKTPKSKTAWEKEIDKIRAKLKRDGDTLEVVDMGYTINKKTGDRAYGIQKKRKKKTK